MQNAAIGQFIFMQLILLCSFVEADEDILYLQGNLRE